MGCTHGKVGGKDLKDILAKFERFSEFENTYQKVNFEKLHFFKLLIPQNEFLTKENFQLIFSQLEKCKNLLHFELVMGKALFRLPVDSGNGFDDSTAIKVAEVITNNPFLETFTLISGNKNNMTQFGLQSITKALVNLKSLYEFRFHIGKGNQIDNEGFMQLITSIVEKNSKKMTYLHLKVTEDTGITREINQKFFNEISKLESLKSLGLELDTSIFDEKQMQSFVGKQSSLEKLTYFQYHYTMLQTKQQVQNIIQTFSTLKNLSYFQFYLPFQDFKDEEVKQLIKTTLPKCQYIDVINKIVPKQSSS